MNATKQYFFVVLFNAMQTLILALMDEFLKLNLSKDVERTFP